MNTLTWTSEDGTETAEQNGITCRVYPASPQGQLVRPFWFAEIDWPGRFEINHQPCFVLIDADIHTAKAWCQTHADAVQKAIDEAVEKGRKEQEGKWEDASDELFAECSTAKKDLIKERALSKQLAEALEAAESFVQSVARGEIHPFAIENHTFFEETDIALAAYEASKTNLDSPGCIPEGGSGTVVKKPSECTVASASDAESNNLDSSLTAGQPQDIEPVKAGERTDATYGGRPLAVQNPLPETASNKRPTT